ncbi:hypothetical protein FSP39_004509 [Pinctada imbricata]|uniref:Uncharacterized protein n=1 Tax=Pinctada imbricata TaxID=66713 RepID=A0AA88YJR4_PINIB|nr:hypothetical protein FSP39_004509 [Pinctada imbricata]
MNAALRSVTKLGDYQRLLMDKLKLKVPDLFQRFENQQNISSDDYLKILIGQLDNNLDTMKKVVESQKNGEMIGLVVQFLVETILDGFVSNYKKVHDKYHLERKFETNMDALLTAIFTMDPEEARILSNPDDPDFENALKRNGIKSADISTLERFKMAPKVLSEMFKDSGKYLADKYTSLKEWGEIDSWDGFKAKAYKTLETPINKMKAVKDFIFDANSRKYTVENFKMEWSEKLMTGIGAIVDVIMQFVSVAEWANVRDQMREAKESYIDYKKKLADEIQNIKDEQVNQTVQWSEIVDTFKELAGAFDELIKNVSSYAAFADVIGLPRLPVNSSNPILHIDLDSLDRNNLMPAQNAYINFLKENDNNMTVLNDKMQARNTLYISIVDKTDKKEVVKDILSDLKGIYKYNPSATIKSFGTRLSKQDIVCTCAILRVDKDEYDYFDLTTFRPECNVSRTDFNNMDKEARAERNKALMDTIVSEKIHEGSSATLSDLLWAVQTAYSAADDPGTRAYGAALTEQDIACSIATQFQSKDMYDYIDLTPFRPSCDAVTAQDFAKLQQNADTLRQLDSQIENAMDTCDSFSFCPCISMLASKFGSTEEQIKASIKRARPKLTQYCGTTGCECVDL